MCMQVIGSTIAPFIVDLSRLLEINQMLILSLLALIGGIPCFYLRETLGQKMLQQICESEV